MGVTRLCAHMLLRESKRERFRGSVVQLGRQDVHLRCGELRHLADTLEVSLTLHDLPDATRLDDELLLRAVGFEEVRALDYSAYQRADIIADLNAPSLPNDIGTFDVVMDFGTMEHLFHIPNALGNAHRLLATGGRYLQMLPTSDQVDHGYYCFSPVLLFDYFEANQYEILDQLLIHVRRGGDWFQGTYDCYRYRPSQWLHEYGSAGMFRSMAVSWSAVRKRDESRCDVMPLQYHYRTQSWTEAPAAPVSALRRALDAIPLVTWTRQTNAFHALRGVRARARLARTRPRPDFSLRFS